MALLLSAQPSLAATKSRDKAPKSRKRPLLAIPDRPPSAGRLRIQTDYPGPSWDWNHDGHRIPASLLHAIHRGLYRMNAGGDAVKDLVESETASLDGTVWTFRLQDDVQWSDGREFTARDAVAGILRAAESTAPETPDAVREIVGFREFHASAAATLSGVRAVSERVLEIRLARPDSRFPLKLADPRTMPVREDLVLAHRDFGFNPAHMAFLGPWMVSESRAALRVSLERNPFAPPSGNVRQLELWPVTRSEVAADLFERNQLDVLLGPVAGTPAGAISSHRPSVVLLRPTSSFLEECNLKCRHSLSAAIDRNSLKELRPAASLLPPELWQAQGLGDFPQEALLAGDQMNVRSASSSGTPRRITIGIVVDSLPRASDLELLRSVARGVAASLQKHLKIACETTRVTAQSSSKADLLMELHEAGSPAVDSFLKRVEGGSASAFWNHWSSLPVADQAAALEKHMKEVLRTQAIIIPLGFGLETVRLKSYVIQDPAGPAEVAHLSIRPLLQEKRGRQ